MSFKRQLQYKYGNLLNALRTISLPDWMIGFTMRVVLSIITVGIGGAYVLQTSSSATRGYEMAALERELTVLETDLQKTDIEIAKHSSLAVIDSQLNTLNMVPADRVLHISPIAASMAKN